MSGWSNSTRRGRLPADWPKRRAAVLKRDSHRCQLGLPGCQVTATEVDHIQAGDNHDPVNLQATCTACHQAKTIAERPRRGSSTERRPAERHPGLL